MDYWLLFVAQIVPVLGLIYYFLHKNYTFWSRRNVAGPTPIPILGNLWQQMRRGQIVTEMEWIQKYGKVFGTYTALEPNLVIADPTLIKQIMIKDFNLFVNRRKAPTVDEMSRQNLFNLEGDDWKRVRTIASPTFTSGKLKGMNKLMGHCVEKLANYFDKLSTTGDGVINTKEVIAGFTIDVIASTSFATETNANDDRNSKEENRFVELCLGIFRISNLRIAANLIFNEQIRKWILKIFPIVSLNFLRELCKQIIKQRRETKERRSDFVQLLMDAYVTEGELEGSDYDKLTATADQKEELAQEFDQNGNVKQSLGKATNKLNDNEIIAQCFIFFIAGFETTASTISHCIFELARNQDIQDRLLRELEKSLGGLDENSDEYYEVISSKIPYLDAVIKETLRKYPPLPRLERRCGVNGYKLAGVTLDKETLVIIAAYAVHHNAEYYPEPERYNPDRFMPENKHLLTPYTYLPFGQGPRNCIGLRFAYQEIRLCLAKILPRYRFSPTAETPEKLNFEKVGLLSVKPFPVKVNKRT